MDGRVSPKIMKRYFHMELFCQMVDVLQHIGDGDPFIIAVIGSRCLLDLSAVKDVLDLF